MFSDSHDSRFKTISVEHNLSQSTVRSIFQDSIGFLWIGTEDGLNLYDGFNFGVFKHDPNDPGSLSSSLVTSICEDRNFDLWIGTDNGLNRYDRKSGKFIRYLNDPKNKESLINNFITVTFVSSKGDLWVGTVRGISRLVSKEVVSSELGFTNYLHNERIPESLSHNFVRVIVEDGDGNLWLGTRGGGLNKFDRESGQFIQYRHDPRNPRSLCNDSVNDIYVGRSGDLWIGTSGGLSRQVFDDDKESDPKFENYRHNERIPGNLSHDEVVAIIEDDDGNLWIGTRGGGLNKFDRESGQFIQYRHDPRNPESLSDDLVTEIYVDLSGVLWIGTNAGGLNKLVLSKEIFRHHKCNPNKISNLYSNFVYSIYESDKNVLWVGTGNGLKKLNREEDKYISRWKRYFFPDYVDQSPINSIREDESGFIWVGTVGNGLLRLNQENGIITEYTHDVNNINSISNDNITVILPSKKGDIWIGTWGGGLNKFDPVNKKFIHFKANAEDLNCLNNNYIRSLCEDEQGILWIGTYQGGLNKFDPEKMEFSHYKNDPSDAGSLSYNNVVTIHESSTNSLWIGTWGGGLNKFDRKSESFCRYTMDDGLSNNVIYGILEDDLGNLWLSTNNGLSKFNPRNEKFINYYKSDGLQSNEFNTGAYYRSWTGEMFFGGINGLTSFFPDKVISNPHIPTVIITEIRKANFSPEFAFELPATRHRSRNKKLEISKKDFPVTIEFVALDYVNPQKNQYAYMIEGLDDGWNYIRNQRSITFSSLKPGEYIFRVKGSNNDGMWNERGDFVNISVKSEPWEIKSLLLISAFFVIFAFFLFMFFRKKSLSFELEREEELNAIYAKYKITKREKQILLLVLQGKKNNEIAKDLYISEGTVKNHIYNIYQKFGVKSRLQVINLIKKQY